MSDCTLHLGDCLAVLPTLEAGSVDAIVTDPPYGLSFMGKEWDSFAGTVSQHTSYKPVDKRPGRENNKVPPTRLTGRGKTIADSKAAIPAFSAFSLAWAQAVLRVVKPGGYMLAFGGTRTFHRLACAIEDAGWEMRDTICYLYGTGFPKGKGCLKPAWEPVLLCRKPGPKVLPLGVEECRVPVNGENLKDPSRFDGLRARSNDGWVRPHHGSVEDIERQHLAMDKANTLGRYPANVVVDDSEEVKEAFAAFGTKTTGKQTLTDRVRNSDKFSATYQPFKGQVCEEGPVLYGDTGSAMRFFYCAKASRSERGNGERHPTQKPIDLMIWLVKLICPVGGLCLDPFLGSGTTALACLQTGRRCVGIERELAYLEIARRRLAEAQGPLFATLNGTDP